MITLTNLVSLSPLVNLMLGFIPLCNWQSVPNFLTAKNRSDEIFAAQHESLRCCAVHTCPRESILEFVGHCRFATGSQYTDRQEPIPLTFMFFFPDPDASGHRYVARGSCIPTARSSYRIKYLFFEVSYSLLLSLFTTGRVEVIYTKGIGPVHGRDCSQSVITLGD